MCGRVRLSSDVSEIKPRLLDPVASTDPEHRAQLECRADGPAPSDPLRRLGRETQLGRDALGARAFWAKDIKVGFANINAKAEGIGNKPALRKDLSAAALPHAG
jgi:hypothetical protein